MQVQRPQAPPLPRRGMPAAPQEPFAGRPRLLLWCLHASSKLAAIGSLLSAGLRGFCLAPQLLLLLVLCWFRPAHDVCRY